MREQPETKLEELIHDAGNLIFQNPKKGQNQQPALHVSKNAYPANEYRGKPEFMLAESTPDAAELATAS